MAGLGPAIHETREEPADRSWMPGPSPGTNDTKIRRNSYGSAMSLLEIRDLGVTFGCWRGAPAVEAVKRASFTLDRGETLALVGESGSGNR
jgi:ABC-type glutathione transport system ATPase component